MAYEDDIEFVPEGASQKRAREEWIAGVRANFPVSRAELPANHRAPFFTSEELELSLAIRREGRVERAKEILQICRGIDLHGSVGNGDLSDDAIAQRLADLIWG